MNRRKFLATAPILGGVAIVPQLLKADQPSDWWPPKSNSILGLGEWTAGPQAELYRIAAKEAHAKGWRYIIELEFEQEYENEKGFCGFFWRLMKPGTAYGNRFLFKDWSQSKDTFTTCNLNALGYLLRLQEIGKL